MQRAGESEEMELVLRPRPYSRQRLNPKMLQLVRRLARSNTIREDATKFEVKGFDQNLGRETTVDVLSDRFVVSKQMVRQDPRGRALISESAYQAIDEAYMEISDDLAAAASIRAP